MMKEVIIKALNLRGKKALEQNIEESKKVKWLQKRKFKQMGYEQIVINTEPLTLTIKINNPHFQQVLDKKTFMFQIINTLEKNGAEEGDFELEVLE